MFISEEEEVNTTTYILICIFLVLFAGLASGLTIGLLSFDDKNLRIIERTGTAKQRQQASKVRRIIKDHHFLLVTLLIANSIAMEGLPLFLDPLVGPTAAIIISVTAVLIFGEILPQALCSKYGLQIGSVCAPVIYFLMVITFVVSWPIARGLDAVLGHDHTAYFKRTELKELITLHGEGDFEAGTHQPVPGRATMALKDSDRGHGHGGEDALMYDEICIIRGALEMGSKNVGGTMTPLEDVFMLDVRGRITREVVDQICDRGHSRIPIFMEKRSQVVGLLLTKSLLKLDPEDEVPIAILDIMVNVPQMTVDTPLYDALNVFQTGRSHMAVVITPPAGLAAGIITLEDVLEELLQEEIYDEADVQKQAREARVLVKASEATTLSLSSPVPVSRAPSTRTPLSGLGRKDSAVFNLAMKFGSRATKTGMEESRPVSPLLGSGSEDDGDSPLMTPVGSEGERTPLIIRD
eukprot:gnl/Dysnectes_brevis/1027_a1145_2159.p1 GENE.gnl/Dysnectes_brevis/1027_a1145_2159~~gnl/Dysnectes_brevis/1027_a1145_2159.p1  ORF type:complete len:466 (-),score=167.83 gnl/Dysnectes_brevis/1027_a1145_2159:107-1504(-)